MQNRLKRNHSIFVVLIFILLAAFQNCSEFRISSDSPTLNDFFKSENNGGSYGGKPDGRYYRFASDFTCESKASAKSSLNIEGSKVSYSASTTNQCSAPSSEINYADLEISEYQNFIVGYREGIFEGKSEVPAGIPANLVEVWCRDSQSSFRLEAISHYDRELKKAVSRIYYSAADGSQRIISDFDVSRVVTSRSVELKGPNEFSLTVNRDQPDQKYGLLKGQIALQLDNQNLQQNVSCRLGGSLDVSVWPAKQLTEFGMYPRNLGRSPDGQHLAFVAAPVGKPLNFYSGRMDGSLPQRLNPAETTQLIHSGGLAAAAFATDSTKISFLATNLTSYKHDLYSFDFQSARLNARHDSANGDTVKVFAGSRDGRYLIFETQLNVPYAYVSRLKSYDFQTGTEKMINPTDEASNAKGIVNGFYFAQSSNRVLFIWDASNNASINRLRVLSVRPDGSSLVDLTPPEEISGRYNLWLPNEGNSAILTVEKSVLSGQRKTWALQVDGSQKSELPQDWTWNFANSNGDLAVLSPLNSETLNQQNKLMNYKTGQLISLPAFETFPIEGVGTQGYGNLSINLPISTIAKQTLDNRETNHPSFAFTVDSSQLIGRVGVSGSEGYQAKAYFIAQDQVRNLCPGLVGKDMWVEELDANRILVSTYNLQTRVLEVYIHDASSGCKKVNSLLSTNSQLESQREVVVSPDKTKILIRVIKNRGRAEVSTQIFYVPLNGGVSYQINLPLAEASEASSAFFSGDSSQVVFLANLSTGSEQSLYLWKVPVGDGGL